MPAPVPAPDLSLFDALIERIERDPPGLKREILAAARAHPRNAHLTDEQIENGWGIVADLFGIE